MNKLTNYLKKAKFWNMVLLVFGAVNGVMSLVEVPAIFNPETPVDMNNPSLANVTDPAIIHTVEKSLAILANPFYQLYTIVMLLISLVLVATFFQNHHRFARGKAVMVWPYYLQVFKLVLAVVASFLTGSAVISPTLTLTTFCLNGAWALPAVLVLYYLKQSIK